MNNYSKLYQSFDQVKLFKILEESDKYEMEAIESAKQELEMRGVSKEEISNFIEQINRKKELAESEIDKNDQSSIENDSLFETIDVINQKVDHADDEKKWRYFFYFLVILTLYHFYQYSYEYLDLLSNGINVRNLYFIGSLAVNLFFIYGLYLFWYKINTGWIIVAIMSTNDLIVESFFWFVSLYKYSDLFSLPYFIGFLISVFFKIGVVWILFRPFFFRIYLLNRKHVVKMWAIAILLSSLYITFQFVTS